MFGRKLFSNHQRQQVTFTQAKYDAIKGSFEMVQQLMERKTSKH